MNNMDKQTSQLLLENQLCFPLYAASRLTTQLYGPYLNELGITYPQYLVLLVLWENKELSVTEIGKKLHLESNTLTPLLKRLEQKQLIIRKRSKEDERSVLVSLTPLSYQLKVKAEVIPEQILQSFADLSVSESEILAFQKTLNLLIEKLKSRV